MSLLASIQIRATEAFVSITLISLAVATSLAHAANTWTGAGADNNWSTPANWDTNAVPASNSDITFSGSARLNINYDMPPASYLIKSMTFDTNAGTYVFNGNEMRVRGVRQTILTNKSSNTQTYNTNLTINYYSTGAESTITFPDGGGPIVLNGTTTYDRIWLFLSGSAGSAGSAGTLVLNGPGVDKGVTYTPYSVDIPTFTFRYNIADCILELGHPQALGEGGVQVNANGTLRAGVALTGDSAIPNGFVIGNANIFTIGGSNDIELSGNIYNAAGNRRLSITNTGETILSGTVCLSNDATARTLTLDIAQAAPPVRIDGPIVDSLVAPPTAATTASRLTKTSPGTLILSATNTYSGATTLSASGGSLYVDGAHVLAVLPDGTNVSGAYTLAAFTTLGGSGRIAPVATAATPASDNACITLAATATLCPGAFAPASPFDATMIDSARSTLTLSQTTSPTRPLLALANGATLHFSLGKGRTATRLAITDRDDATSHAVTFNNNIVTLTDLANGALSSGTHTLITADAPGAFSGLTTDADGNITAGLTLTTINGSTITSTAYDGSKLKLVSTPAGAAIIIDIATVPDSAPTGGVAGEVTQTGFTASWDAVSGATSYQIAISTSETFAEGSFVEGYENFDVGNNLSHAVTGLAADTQYYYRVRATNAAGAGAWSETVSFATALARAVNTWTGAGPDNNWSTGANWDDGTVPLTNSDVTFSGSARLDINYDMPPDSYLIKSMTFDTNAGAYVFNGNEMRVPGVRQTLLTNKSPNTQTYNTDITINFSTNNGDTTITFPDGGGPIVLNGTTTYDRIWLLLSGSAGSAGTLVLNGPGVGKGVTYTPYSVDISTFTFRYNIADSILDLGHPHALGEGGVQVNANGTIRASVALTGASAIPNGFVIGNANIFTISGSNDIELSGNIYNAGGNRTISVTNTGSTVFSGTLMLSNDTTTSRTLTMNILPAAVPTIVRGGIVNSATANAGVANNIIKNGPGLLRFDGVNSYTGRTTVNAGSLYVNGTHAPVATVANSVAGAYAVSGSGLLGGNGWITPSTNGAVVAGGIIQVSGTLRPGDYDIDPDGDLKINGDLATLTINQGTASQPALSMAAGAKMVFHLGLDLTSTKVKLAGTSPKPMIANSTTLTFVDIVSGTLAEGDYTLFEMDSRDAIENITFDGEGNVTAGLVLGAGLEDYSDCKLRASGNNIVVHVGHSRYIPYPPVINSNLNVTGTGGVPFEYNITADNFPTAYTAGPLPAGLSIDGSTGLISGTPVVAGTFDVTLGVSNAGGSDSATLVITIPARAPQIIPEPRVSGMAGMAFSYAIPSMNLPTAYTTSVLPDGLSLDQATGKISGTPTVAGVFDITLTATNDQGSGSIQITLIIDPKSSLTLLAGTPGVSGPADGTSDAASFNKPAGAVADSAGNLYIADSLNNTIRRIATDGTVTTFAGISGTGGNLDGPAAEALFKTPVALAIDAAGTTLFIADGGNNAIRKIDMLTGEVSTQALYASMEGYSTDRIMASPSGLAFDPAGNLYIANSAAHTIHKVAPGTGITTVIAGLSGVPGAVDGVGPEARFTTPKGIALDAEGAYLYVADTGNSTIRRITLATATVETIAGSAEETGGTDGMLGDARFLMPQGLAVDAAGCIYVADTGNNTIRKIDYIAKTAGTLAGLAGETGSADGFGPGALLNAPAGIAIDAAGELYILDSGNHIIRVMQTAPRIVTQPASQTVPAGSQVIFKAGVSGAPTPACQWYKNSTPVEDATGAMLVIESAQAADAASYSVIITNPMGSEQSDAATLTVNASVGSGNPGSGDSGGGGGGGAPAPWYFGALVMLAALGKIRRHAACTNARPRRGATGRAHLLHENARQLTR